MDKETLSHYGWIVIVVLVLAIMLALATPFGTYVGDAVAETARGFVGTAENNLNEDNIKEQDIFWDYKFENGVENGLTEIPQKPNFVGTVNLSASLEKKTDNQEYEYLLAIRKENDASINSMSFSIGWNSNKVEFVDDYRGGIFSEYLVNASNNSIGFTGYSSANKKTTGQIVYLSFNSKNSEELNISDFTFTPGITSNYKGECFNVEMTNFTIINEYNYGTIVNKDKPKANGYNPGDINNDGYINSIDYNLLKKILFGVTSECKAADTNGDGVVDIRDGIRLQKFLSKDPSAELLPSSATDEEIPLDYIIS